MAKKRSVKVRLDVGPAGRGQAMEGRAESKRATRHIKKRTGAKRR